MLEHELSAYSELLRALDQVILALFVHFFLTLTITRPSLRNTPARLDAAPTMLHCTVGLVMSR